MSFRLDGKAAFITGAGSGIGASIAEVFSRAGAFVIVADISKAAAEATVARLNGDIGGVALTLDVANEEQCLSVATTILKDRAVPIVVNNAGIGHVGTILQTTAADLDRLYAVNVRGVLNVSRAFLPAMQQKRSGSIVNMASIGGIVGVRDRVAYCATKFAVVGLTKSMALDHATEGIRINCICPGRVETPFVAARIKEYADPAKAHAEMSATQAIGRMASPEEIAHAALYLACDESSFATGSALVIDGGWSAGK